MHDKNKCRSRRETNGSPSLFTVNYRIRIRNSKRIIENQRGVFKVDAMYA